MRKIAVTLVMALALLGAACTSSKVTPGTTTTTNPSTSTTEGSTSTTKEPTSTTKPPTITTQAPSTTTTKPIITSYEGIYPFSNGVQADNASDAWKDPVFTAQRFLTDYVGFTRLIMGGFRQGDNRSGEVTATTRAGGFVTTVFVRKIGSGDNWTVVGASTDNIQINHPNTGQTISSPVKIEGVSIAFEGTVLVEVRQDGQYNKDGELGFAAITGPGTEKGPMSGEINFKTPTTPSGAIIAYTDSAEDGHIQEVTAVKVRF